MKLKHALKTIGLISAVIMPGLAFTSCDGHNDDNAEEKPKEEKPEIIEYTHAELADLFVKKMKTDLGIDLSILKTDTLQYDYIVVEDYDLYDKKTDPYYTAYYIGDYKPGDDLASYIIDHDNDFHYPLVDNEDGTYSGFDGFGNYATF